MSKRLDQERQQRLEPTRRETAIEAFTQLGFDVMPDGEKALMITFKGSIVRFFPYTGWHTGKTIEDGRGLDNLLKQLKA